MALETIRSELYQLWFSSLLSGLEEVGSLIGIFELRSGYIHYIALLHKLTQEQDPGKLDNK